MGAFLKIAVPTIAFALIGVMNPNDTQAFELFKSTPEACLAKNNSVVQPHAVDTLSDSCRSLLLSPKRGAPAAAHYAFAGTQIREVALACKGKYGSTALMADIKEKECRVFYFPTMSDALVAAFRAPSNNIDQLY